MKVLVIGSRRYNRIERLNTVLDNLHAGKYIHRLIVPLKAGASSFAADWAFRNEIPVEQIPLETLDGQGVVRRNKVLLGLEPDCLVVADEDWQVLNLLTMVDEKKVQVLDVE